MYTRAMFRRLALAFVVLAVSASSAEASAEKTHRAANTAVEWWVGAFADGDVKAVDTICMRAFRRPGTWECDTHWRVRLHGRLQTCYNPRVIDSPDYITWDDDHTRCSGDPPRAYRARH